jgi:ABC-2 type transport system ATP-binding protein
MCNAPATALDARGVSKRFGEVRALHGVSLRAHRGEIHGLLGPNGAGKTTLLRIVLGLVRRETGDIRLLDGELPMRPMRVPEGVAAVFEGAGFYPYLSARRNLTFLARLDGMPVAHASIERAMSRAGVIADADRKLGGFSAGMRQRVALAAALVRAPRLLLLDEPTSALDPAGVRDVRALAKELAAEGTAIVFSSHDLVEVEELCSTVTILRQGQVVFDGTVAALRALAGETAYAMSTSDATAALAIAARIEGVRVTRSAIEVDGLDVTGARGAMDAYVVALGQAGVAVRSLQPRERSLETMFLQLTAHGPAS